MPSFNQSVALSATVFKNGDHLPNAPSDQNLNSTTSLATSDSSNSYSNDHFQTLTKCDSVISEVSVLRNILNPTSNTSKTSQPTTAVDNNNDQNCNHNIASVKFAESVADVTRDVLQDVQKTCSDPIQPNSIESILCEAIKLEFEAYSSLAQFHSSSRELNDAERAKLNELIVANKSLLAPVDDDFHDLVTTDDFCFNVSCRGGFA